LRRCRILVQKGHTLTYDGKGIHRKWFFGVGRGKGTNSKPRLISKDQAGE
jgi:hypothetical protein